MLMWYRSLLGVSHILNWKAFQLISNCLLLCSFVKYRVCLYAMYNKHISFYMYMYLSTLGKKCIHFDFSSSASFALRGKHHTVCNNVGFFCFVFGFFFFSTFSTCSTFDKLTVRCYPHLLFFFFLAQTQSAPIKHKVLFSPVDVVIPPFLENWQ